MRSIRRRTSCCSRFRNTFTSLIAFINAKKIITIPSTVEPTLEETPPFMRATTQASMDTPGAYEKHSTTAYFNVTLPEKNWPAARTSEYMAAFNRGTIISTSVHEAYPGHYVQFLWVNHGNLSAVRKLTGSSTNIEGWAHYCEQMMLDEGYNQPGVGGEGRARVAADPAGPAAGCAAARCAVHRGHSHAHPGA